MHASKYSQLPSEKVSLPSTTLEREKGAMETLNVREPTLSICFISKSPSCIVTDNHNSHIMHFRNARNKEMKEGTPHLGCFEKYKLIGFCRLTYICYVVM